MDPSNNGRPFTSGQCLRCGALAVGGICADCLADLSDFLAGAGLADAGRAALAEEAPEGPIAAALQRWAAAGKKRPTTAPAPASSPPISCRRCKVRFRRSYSAGCPGAPGSTRYWRAGEISTLWQVSRRYGVALDPATDAWWTDFDIDYAYIVPAQLVEVLAVLEERAEGGEVGRGHA